MRDVVSLEDLGVMSDPGTAWHPCAEKTEARDAEGHLCDLIGDEVELHFEKPETLQQPDGLRTLSAEDSRLTPQDAV